MRLALHCLAKNGRALQPNVTTNGFEKDASSYQVTCSYIRCIFIFISGKMLRCYLTITGTLTSRYSSDPHCHYPHDRHHAHGPRSPYLLILLMITWPWQDFWIFLSNRANSGFAGTCSNSHIVFENGCCGRGLIDAKHIHFLTVGNPCCSKQLFTHWFIVGLWIDFKNPN